MFVNVWRSYRKAACESFRKTLKYEEVYRNEYRDPPPIHQPVTILL